MESCEERILVSVIIPLYNRENYIEKSVKSVLDQTYGDLEVIVVDDCSKDSSVEVVKKIQTQDKRVKLICCETNGGACRARNIGIDHANGEYIAFQDSDDCWHKDKLEKSLDALRREDADLVFCALSREEVKNGKTYKEVIPVFNLNEENNKFERLLYNNYISTQTIVAKSEIFKEIHFDENFPRFQDWELMIQVLKRQYKVFYVNEILVDTYVLTDSITSNGQKALDAFQLLEKKYKEDYEIRPVVYKKFCERAAFIIEMSGLNGADYFMNSYKTEKNISVLLKYILAKIRLYRPLNLMLSKIKGI